MAIDSDKKNDNEEINVKSLKKTKCGKHKIHSVFTMVVFLPDPAAAGQQETLFFQMQRGGGVLGDSTEKDVTNGIVA